MTTNVFLLSFFFFFFFLYVDSLLARFYGVSTFVGLFYAGVRLMNKISSYIKNEKVCVTMFGYLDILLIPLHIRNFREENSAFLL